MSPPGVLDPRAAFRPGTIIASRYDICRALSRLRCYGRDESACTSPTLISAPWGTPVAFGLSTITWIARTVIPLLVAPEQGKALPPSHVCSLRVTEPIPGTRMVVLGGGLSLTAMPPTESPSSAVPSEPE